jgi:hypothetical protein
MYNTVSYIIYLSLVLATVIFVGGFLFRNGRFFLEDIFHNDSVVSSVNRFLYAGYCLVNAGGAFRCLYKTEKFSSYLQGLEYVAVNIGQLLLLLGTLHFANMVLLPLLKNIFTPTPQINPKSKNKN